MHGLMREGWREPALYSTLHMEVGVAKPEVLVAFMKSGAMPPYMNHHPKFQVELPAIAAGVKANAAVLLVLLAK